LGHRRVHAGCGNADPPYGALGGPPRAEARGERFDFVGTAVYGAALAALMYGLSLLPKEPGPLLVGAGLLGIAAFVLWETRIDHALLHVELLSRNRVFAFSSLAALLHYSATAGSGFLVSLYLQYLKGLSPREAGAVLLAQPLVMAVFSAIAGRLSDRAEPRVMASAGMALSAVGMALLALLTEQTSMHSVVVCLLLLGLGFALFSSPNMNAVMSSVDRKLYGVASGTVGTMRLVGQMLSMGLVMWMLSTHVGQKQLTPALHGAFLQCATASYHVFAGLCAVGVLASLARGTVRGGDESATG